VLRARAGWEARLVGVCAVRSRPVGQHDSRGGEGAAKRRNEVLRARAGWEARLVGIRAQHDSGGVTRRPPGHWQAPESLVSPESPESPQSPSPKFPSFPLFPTISLPLVPLIPLMPLRPLPLRPLHLPALIHPQVE